MSGGVSSFKGNGAGDFVSCGVATFRQGATVTTVLPAMAGDRFQLRGNFSQLLLEPVFIILNPDGSLALSNLLRGRRGSYVFVDGP